MADGKKTIFTLTVFAAAHESRASELAHIAQACQGAAKDARGAGGAKLNGIVLADGAVPIGEWRFDPVAPA
jgi:hypothetical protein